MPDSVENSRLNPMSVSGRPHDDPNVGHKTPTTEKSTKKKFAFEGSIVSVAILI